MIHLRLIVKQTVQISQKLEIQTVNASSVYQGFNSSFSKKWFSEKIQNILIQQRWKGLTEPLFTRNCSEVKLKGLFICVPFKSGRKMHNLFCSVEFPSQYRYKCIWDLQFCLGHLIFRFEQYSLNELYNGTLVNCTLNAFGQLIEEPVFTLWKLANNLTFK